MTPYLNCADPLGFFHFLDNNKLGKFGERELGGLGDTSGTNNNKLQQEQQSIRIRHHHKMILYHKQTEKPHSMIIFEHQ